MLEQLLIFTRGGLVLWSSCHALKSALKGSPIDALIQSCLLEERSASSSYTHESYTLKWAFHNELGLVFVAVYQRIFHLLYVDDLLTAVRDEFCAVYDPKRMEYSDFDETFRQLQKEAEARAEEMKKMKQNNKVLPVPVKKGGRVGTGFEQNGTKKGSNGNGGNKDDSDGGNKGFLSANGKESNKSGRVGSVVNNTKGKENGKPESGAFDVNKLRMKSSKGGNKKEEKKAAPAQKGEAKKIVKKNRVWDEKKTESESEVKLDFTDERGEERESGLEKVEIGESMMDKEEVFSESEGEEEEDGGEMEKQGAKKKSWFTSMFQSIAGNNALEKSDLQPALKALKDRLMTKNVAEEIAEKLCESVAASLEGKKLGSFTRVSSTVQTAMEEALVRILTPKRSIDILREVNASKEQGKPYVIVFVGVNGVGKSTNLAKVAYWLQQHDVSVMMAACDTFRSGAVEQLRTHARRLQIPIFEKGYEKDPAIVAKEAIQEAARNKSDVVLVDTAGRMQDNEPLMRALSKLINLNNPNLVLFVGEALVGNDAVDQLSKFNQKLADLSAVPNARLIDGILLTKFDTIDDKVGAALSMVYISGAPVMFVGCGQSYTDLKKLNVKSIVKTLIK
ncbi:hypothetical protein LUZ60_010515 [Juncus effusus]|nr:hypothetical protein LUZ60_010515 [Juncus effusus]